MQPLTPTQLLVMSPAGIYCPLGEFYVDPVRRVPRAIITHAHSDHARPGSDQYLTSAAGKGVLQARLGASASILSIDYGEPVRIGDVIVTLIPAGHILGSAQVRIEHRGEVCVVSGDYKLQADPTCAPFEPVRCHTFITESTFGLPVYQWPDPGVVLRQINGWWRTNADAGRTSLVFAYSLGKAQRLLTGLDQTIGPLVVHGAIADLLPHYMAAGVIMPAVMRLEKVDSTALPRRALIIAPGAAHTPPWLQHSDALRTASASGWLLVRAARRSSGLNQAFVLSDHADWPGLHQAIAATGAERIGVMHGFVDVMVRYLTERGLDAFALLPSA